MTKSFNMWMQRTLGTTDEHEAALIIWNTFAQTPAITFEHGLYHAMLGRKGHGIGLSEDEAVVQAVWDAYFTPFNRDLVDLQIWRDRELKDLNDDLSSGKTAQVVYAASLVVVDAQYKERHAALLEKYAAQVDILAIKDDETGQG